MGHAQRRARVDAAEDDDETLSMLSAVGVANVALMQGGDESRSAADRDDAGDDIDRSASARSASSIFHM